jgi:hypothetical protein
VLRVVVRSDDALVERGVESGDQPVAAARAGGRVEQRHLRVLGVGETGQRRDEVVAWRARRIAPARLRELGVQEQPARRDADAPRLELGRAPGRAVVVSQQRLAIAIDDHVGDGVGAGKALQVIQGRIGVGRKLRRVGQPRHAGVVQHEVARDGRLGVIVACTREGRVQRATDRRIAEVTRRQVAAQLRLQVADGLADHVDERGRQVGRLLRQQAAGGHRTQEAAGLRQRVAGELQVVDVEAARADRQLEPRERRAADQRQAGGQGQPGRRSEHAGIVRPGPVA